MRPATTNTGGILVATHKETHLRVTKWTLDGKYVLAKLARWPKENTVIWVRPLLTTHLSKITPPTTPFKRRGVYAQSVTITISNYTYKQKHTDYAATNPTAIFLWTTPRVRYTQKVLSREPPSGSPENNESWAARGFTLKPLLKRKEGIRSSKRNYNFHWYL